jgi:SAM-dependent methyltransferase
MSSNFNLYSKYYNLLYADKDYQGETSYIKILLQKYFPTAKSILEFGSGTGVHGLKLVSDGYNVFGLERSESMVAEAKSNGFSCQVADISNFNLNRKFDCVISLFHVISYLTNNNDLLNCFRNAHLHLNENGVFIFDIWYSPAVYHLKAIPRIKRMQDKDISVIRFADPEININANMIDVKFTVLAKDLHTNELNEFTENHPMRHFSIPEIGLLAECTGFEIEKAEEFLSGNDPGENTWGVCFILKKK